MVTSLLEGMFPVQWRDATVYTNEQASHVRGNDQDCNVQVREKFQVEADSSMA